MPAEGTRPAAAARVTELRSAATGAVRLHGGRTPRLVLQGEVDAALVDGPLLATVGQLARSGLDVDVSRVTFLDARGLGLLLAALGHRTSRRGHLVGRVPAAVRRVADAAGVPIRTP